MAEVHIIGQIESAYSFPDNQLCCRWSLQVGGGWRVMEGTQFGQTQTDLPTTDEAYFCHPIDIHLGTKTIQGWPKINIEVWHQDQYGRQEIYGYGTVFIPSSPGEHMVECQCWRPRGSLRDEFMQYFVGGGLKLTSMRALEQPIERIKLKTITMGVIRLRLSIIMRNFEHFGVSY